MSEKTKAKPGRPTKAPEGRRIIFHISLSPRAMEGLTELCDRPIAPLEKSTFIEHLIMEKLEQEAKHKDKAK